MIQMAPLKSTVEPSQILLYPPPLPHPSPTPIPNSELPPMDWYSWLSKSGLEPSLVYDYSLLFTHNELEEEDIVHFNHDFLLSMGISIAKHRLEILKLAKQLQKRRPPMPISRLLAAVKKTKNCVSRYLESLVIGKEHSSAIVVVPKGNGNGGARWNETIMRRMVLFKQGRLMISDGGVKVNVAMKHGQSPGSAHGANPMVKYKDGDDDIWGSEEIRWDSMFQNLKPT